MNQIESRSHMKLYLASYSDQVSEIPLIVDTTQEVVRFYMKEIRRLDKHQIVYRRLSSSSDVSSPAELLAEELLPGVFLPHRDSLIISSDADKYEGFLDHFLLDYQEVLKLLSKTRSFQADTSLLTRGYTRLEEEFNSPKRMHKLYKGFVRNHELMKMPIQEYLYRIGLFQEEREMDRRYQYLIRERTPVDD